MPDAGTFGKNHPVPAHDFISEFIAKEEAGQLRGFVERLEAVVGADELACETMLAFKPSITLGEAGVGRLGIFKARAEGFHQHGCAAGSQNAIHFRKHPADFPLPGIGIPTDGMGETPALDGEVSAGRRDRQAAIIGYFDVDVGETLGSDFGAGNFQHMSRRIKSGQVTHERGKQQSQSPSASAELDHAQVCEWMDGLQRLKDIALIVFARNKGFVSIGVTGVNLLEVVGHGRIAFVYMSAVVSPAWMLTGIESETGERSGAAPTT